MNLGLRQDVRDMKCDTYTQPEEMTLAKFALSKEELVSFCNLAQYRAKPAHLLEQEHTK